jgi:endoplasmic reticulum-Golgi intermediate compartment protein 3
MHDALCFPRSLEKDIFLLPLLPNGRLFCLRSQVTLAMGLKERLKSFDAQSSVSNEFRVYTTQGAVLSVLTVLIILYLVVSEARFNFQINLKESVHVNATTSRGLEMEFDITLWEVPCAKLQIDASDHLGQAQSLHLDKEHHLWKHRVKRNADGSMSLIGAKTKLELGSTLKSEAELVELIYSTEEEIEEVGGCGSCYGAGEEGECCNTCEDVQRAYRTRGWNLQLGAGHNIVQCKNAPGSDDSYEKGEGCNVHGVVALSTGGGNLHLAPGKEVVSAGMTILEALMQSYQEWNVSHTLHKMRFGPEYPAAKYQLDGESRTIEDVYGMYQYYLQVSVPSCQ